MKAKIKYIRVLTAENGDTEICIGTNNKQCFEIYDIKERLGKGEEFELNIEKWVKKRSLNANAYFHLLVDELAKALKIGADELKIKMVLEYGTIAVDEMGKKVGIKIPKAVNIEDFYSYAKWFGEETINDVDFNFYIFYKQTHKLNSKEMAQLIDGVAGECKQMGIKTLDEIELKNMCERWNKK